jgi:hypothetical protein
VQQSGSGPHVAVTPVRLVPVPLARLWADQTCTGKPLRTLRSRTPDCAWAQRAVGEGVTSCWSLAFGQDQHAWAPALAAAGPRAHTRSRSRPNAAPCAPCCARHLQLANDLLVRPPFDKVLAPDPPNRLHNQHPPATHSRSPSGQPVQLIPEGVKVGRRSPLYWGESSTPKHTAADLRLLRR